MLRRAQHESILTPTAPSPFEIVSLSCLLAKIVMSRVVAPFSITSSATFAALYTGIRISLN
jgi:hypothetical protein